MLRKTSKLTAGPAFKALYADHQINLLGYFASRVFDPQLALELCAETFAQAFIDRGKFRGSEDREAAAWLYSIASRRLADYYRRGTAERKALRRLGIELPAATSEELDRVERLADLDDARSAIRDGLRSLDDLQRLALQLRVVDERPYTEVAMQLGVSEQTARARVSRALKALGDSVDLDPTIKELT